MPDIHRHQPSFARGEISPQLAGRVDLQLFHAALAACRDFLPTPKGIVVRRGGTKFLGEAKNTDKNTRLIPFIFDENEGYALEVTENAIRFWQAGGQVVDGGSPVELATSYASSEIWSIDYAQSADVMTLVHGSHAPAELARTSHTAWSLTDVTFEAGPFQKYDTNDITVNVSGSDDMAVGDVVTITSSADVFAASDVGHEIFLELANLDDVPKWEGNQHSDPNSTDPAASLYKSTVGQRVRANGNVYQAKNAKLIGVNPPDHSEGEQAAGDDRTTWIYKHDGEGRARITAFTNAQTVTATVSKTIPKEIVTGGGTDTFRMPDWTSLRGYPQKVGFHDDRRLFARTATKPMSLWASVLDDYANMQDGTDADLAISKTMTPGRGRVSAVQWMVSEEVLMLGLAAEEKIGRAKVLGDFIQPGDFTTKTINSKGSAGVKPVALDGALFLSRDRKRLLEMAFNGDLARMDVEDLSEVASHLLEDGITEIAFQDTPYPVLWCVRDDGKLLSFSWRKAQDVRAWALHDLSGALVKSITVVPNSDGVSEDLFLLVERTVNGTTKRYLEVMQKPFTIKVGEPATDAWYLDSALELTGRASSSLSGLDHLEGETVQVFVDGEVREPKTVTAGSIQLDRPVTTRALVGLHTPARIVTLNPEFALADGATADKKRRTRAITVRARGIGGKAGIEGGRYPAQNLKPSYGAAADTASVCFDASVKVSPGQGFANDQRIEIIQDQPLPLEVLALVANMEVAD